MRHLQDLNYEAFTGFELDVTPILFIYLHDKILHFPLLLLKKMQRGKSLDSTKDSDFFSAPN